MVEMDFGKVSGINANSHGGVSPLQDVYLKSFGDSLCLRVLVVCIALATKTPRHEETQRVYEAGVLSDAGLT
ncbi:MAG: hypothetical protein FD123_4029 [Bacteroidetes bacterium]|nr:MAG: hypothetical protein FD123_4029 [Bacteroidota bacterium]